METKSGTDGKEERTHGEEEGDGFGMKKLSCRDSGNTAVA